jgi:hypothetical protein
MLMLSPDTPAELIFRQYIDVTHFFDMPLACRLIAFMLYAYVSGAADIIELLFAR